nr:CP52k-like protein 11 [Membranobalanus longirostrum]
MMRAAVLISVSVAIVLGQEYPLPAGCDCQTADSFPGSEYLSSLSVLNEETRTLLFPREMLGAWASYMREFNENKTEFDNRLAIATVISNIEFDVEKRRRNFNEVDFRRDLVLLLAMHTRGILFGESTKYRAAINDALNLNCYSWTSDNILVVLRRFRTQIRRPNEI